MKVTAWTDLEYASSHYINIDDKLTNCNEEDKKKFNELEKMLIQCVIEHCKETGIRFFSNYHQYGDCGIPIIDNKYMVLVSLRKWGEMMALADNDTDEKAYLHYYLSDSDYYSAIKLPFEVESEICC